MKEIDKKDAIIDMVNKCYPHISVTHRAEDIQYLKIWKEFRRDILKFYGITFKEYATRIKSHKEFFSKLERRSSDDS